MSIRASLLQKSPFSERITKRYPDTPASDSALAYAVEGLLRSTSGVGGFDFFYVAEESSKILKIIGLADLLPNSLLPLEASFWLDKENIAYRTILGSTLPNGRRFRNQNAGRQCIYTRQKTKPPFGLGPPLQKVFSLLPKRRVSLLKATNRA